MAIRILCLDYACMQPCKSKGLNWPFLHFSGGLSLNALVHVGFKSTSSLSFKNRCTIGVNNEQLLLTVHL